MDILTDFIMNKARKASGTFVVTLAGAGGTAMLDGSLSGVEAIGAVGLALVATASAYGFTNSPKVTGKHAAR